MVNNKWVSGSETAMTIAWLAMDCFWMNDMLVWAQFMSLIGMMCIFVMHIILTRLGDIEAEVAQAAVSCWFFMNTFWMLSEQHLLAKDLSKMMMIPAIILTLGMLLVNRKTLLRFRRSKK